MKTAGLLTLAVLLMAGALPATVAAQAPSDMPPPFGGGGGGSGHGVGTGPDTDKVPPITWEYLVIPPPALRSFEQKGQGDVANPVADVLQTLDRPLLIHACLEDSPPVNERTKRIMDKEPQFQDEFDGKIFNTQPIRKLCLHFRCMRVNARKSDERVLKILGVTALPAVLVFSAKKEPAGVFSGSDVGSSSLTAAMVKVLTEVGLGKQEERQQARLRYYQGLLDDAEKLYDAKDYSPAYRKYFEIVKDTRGAIERTIAGKAQLRKEAIERSWLNSKEFKDERKRVQGIGRNYDKAVQDLRAKRFDAARSGFQAVIESDQKRGEIWWVDESQRVLKEMESLAPPKK